tara:strand:+ start:10017 stop:10142 length:126 start_codon:yes stop_codon:yes gene_type:complete
MNFDNFINLDSLVSNAKDLSIEKVAVLCITAIAIVAITKSL